jgi:signal transduction histidine kinase
VREGLAPLLMADYGLENDICVALLDDNGKPVAKSRPGFETDWKRPFVATEIGEQLPHWEVGIYLLDPGKFDKSARDLKWSLRTMVTLMLLAILTGGGLLVWDVQRQLRLARQKTDFVSNVSHELKTPLTSIRMFSELLAAGKASDPGQSRSYASIIAAEASRLTRLINNVLDFSRMERGEKKYEQGPVAIMELVQETTENYRPHLEAHGFALQVRTEETDVEVKADRDAVAQIILNLISNAEKYGGESKQIEVEAETGEDLVRVAVMDRGEGVAAGQEEKIFEQFYRAHDSLSSGIQGSGLGLTLARQMARAQGGDVVYQSRPGGGSIFTVKLPIWRDVGTT